MNAQPNFLFFITDQHRADHLGAYGNREVRTPHLDRLAARSWLAERCYVASPVCMPNRATLLTGRWPSAHGVRHNGIALSLRTRTFLDQLRDAGYRTALAGKGHLQNMTGKAAVWPAAGAPAFRPAAMREDAGRYDQEWAPAWQASAAHEMALPYYGFDDVALAIDHGDTAGGHYRRWLEREHPGVAARVGREHALPSPGYVLADAGQAWRTQAPEECHPSAWIADQTMRMLDGYARGDKPFFLQCSFPDPHHPFTPPGRYWDMYAPEDVRLPASFDVAGRALPPHVAWLHAERERGAAVKHTPALFACTEREAREAIALNYGSISFIDAMIGKVLAHLQTLGLADNTVVVFSSDHGDYMGDHQLLWKGPIHYQSIIRVPFLWHDPQAGGDGARSQALCSSADLAPTVLERAGVAPFNGIQGASLLPLIDAAHEPAGAAPDNWRDAVLIEEEAQRQLFGFAARPRVRTLQTGRFRLSLYDGQTWGELYDLAEDPHELRNLWSEPAYAQHKAEAMERLGRTMLALSDTSPYPTAIA
ncbi:sulfatase [Burkholderia sp. SRS-W-2-2016]|uniref:sulfatase-like hydrolase/transferase n=1 Tax=Burkholderia sp. SRS-W-2-2016 TaxID=1926878 RepID=UPI00094B634D|nr:sulfatase-like hydrolase/transferase [Burkholderia sp. SRS-W-2-2016]OLL30794.1 sulfatase [Burkholderia sp. SRS-W-2-2016]